MNNFLSTYINLATWPYSASLRRAFRVDRALVVTMLVCLVLLPINSYSLVGAVKHGGSSLITLYTFGTVLPFMYLVVPFFSGMYKRVLWKAIVRELPSTPLATYYPEEVGEAQSREMDIVQLWSWIDRGTTDLRHMMGILDWFNANKTASKKSIKMRVEYARSLVRMAFTASNTGEVLTDADRNEVAYWIGYSEAALSACASLDPVDMSNSDWISKESNSERFRAGFAQFDKGNTSVQQAHARGVSDAHRFMNQIEDNMKP